MNFYDQRKYGLFTSVGKCHDLQSRPASVEVKEKFLHVANNMTTLLAHICDLQSDL